MMAGDDLPIKSKPIVEFINSNFSYIFYLFICYLIINSF